MMQYIQSFLSQHLTAVLFVVGYIFVAFLNHLPAPGTPFKLYPWFYDSIRTLLNLPGLQKFEVKNTENK